MEPDLTTPRGVADRRDDLVILDVREPAEWEAGRVEGSVHVPLNDLMAGSMPELDEDRPIVAVCSVGGRSQVAALLLQARGYEAHNLDGGLQRWVAEGLPLTTPAGEPGRVA
ncbi:MAG TPA: rhodanese-like domain-containing protein [Actinomycetota bacterium]|nr:rhodanese-like domain-containing protein [Actinomycetota bacterium]